jgi:hypothetical protein
VSIEVRESQELELHRESKQKDPQRFTVIVVVLALHLAIITLLFLSSKARLAFPAARPIELIYLPSNVVLRKPPPMSVAQKNEMRTTRLETATTAPALPQSLSVTTLPGNADTGQPIDWTQQAQSVASEIASRGSTPSVSDPVEKSPFAPPPTHHAGEEFVTAGGDRAVFINEHCYQVAKTFADVTDGIANGMGTQTYCIHPSDKARGDLFDQLPAYKKLHPSPSTP